MSIKLADTQLMMLSAAAQRDVRCLVVAPNLKVAAAQKIASKLTGAGLVKEIRAKAERLCRRKRREPPHPAFSPPFSRKKAITSSTPSPVFMLAMTNGRVLRCARRRAAITSSEAPT